MPGPPRGPSLRITSTSPAGVARVGDRGERVLLALEDARRAFEHARLQARDLDQRAVGREVAFQHDDAAGRMQRASRARARPRRRAPAALASSSASVRPDSASASPCRWPPSSSAFSTGGDAADAVQVEREVLAAGLQVGDQRRAREHLGDVVEREADAGLVRDRRQVQAGVGRAAGRGDRGGGVLERLARDEVARQRPAVARRSRRRGGRRGAPARGARRRRPAASPSRAARGRASRRPSPSCWR